jgi:hypothetical protein
VACARPDAFLTQRLAAFTRGLGHARYRSHMDALFMLLTLALFALGWGFVETIERL